ncbi:MAG: hypothetical protein IH987_05340 [Planctomycetes bacterium]|nr:hypothetical protein [Planctomycetota bacterium]
MTGRRKRIRILNDKPPPSFSQRLELQAREIVRRGRQREGQDPIVLLIERDIALTLDHLDRLRDVHREIRSSLMRHECNLGTAILQRTPPPPVYEDPRLPERDRLRDRIRHLDEERRRWSVQYVRDRQAILDRLLSLANRHRQLRY